jgi:hypothetical protein
LGELLAGGCTLGREGFALGRQFGQLVGQGGLFGDELRFGFVTLQAVLLLGGFERRLSPVQLAQSRGALAIGNIELAPSFGEFGFQVGTQPLGGFARGVRVGLMLGHDALALGQGVGSGGGFGLEPLGLGTQRMAIRFEGFALLGQRRALGVELAQPGGRLAGEFVLLPGHVVASGLVFGLRLGVPRFAFGQLGVPGFGFIAPAVELQAEVLQFGVTLGEGGLTLGQLFGPAGGFDPVPLQLTARGVELHLELVARLFKGGPHGREFSTDRFEVGALRLELSLVGFEFGSPRFELSLPGFEIASLRFEFGSLGFEFGLAPRSLLGELEALVFQLIESGLAVTFNRGKLRLTLGQLGGPAGGFGLLPLQLTARGIELGLQLVARLFESGPHGREFSTDPFDIGALRFEFGSLGFEFASLRFELSLPGFEFGLAGRRLLGELGALVFQLIESRLAVTFDRGQVVLALGQLGVPGFEVIALAVELRAEVLQFGLLPGDGRLALDCLGGLAGGFGLESLELIAAGVKLPVQPLALLFEVGSRRRELDDGRFVFGARGVEFGLAG